MTLKKLTDIILNVASTEKNVNYVGEGDVYSLNSIPDVDYSVFWLTLNNASVGENSISYSYTFFYIDRLSNEDDDRNKLKIQSDGIQRITNIVNKLNYTEDVDINFPLQFTAFKQRFADDCAGVFCTVNVLVDNNLGICEF